MLSGYGNVELERVLLLDNNNSTYFVSEDTLPSVNHELSHLVFTGRYRYQLFFFFKVRKLRHRGTKSLVQGYTAKENLNHLYLTPPLCQWRNGIILGRVLSKVTLIAVDWGWH